MTFAPDPAVLFEVQLAEESTLGTYQAPTLQFATTDAPTFGAGHQVIQGSALTSTIEKVITHSTILGIDVPFVSFEVPLSANGLPTLFHMLFGSALASNEWAVNGNPPGFTILVNAQRADPAVAGHPFKFLGCKVASASMSMSVGTMPTLRLDCVALQILYPDSGAAAAITLAPPTTSRPYVLQDCTLRHNSVVGSVAGSGAIEFQGFTIDVDMGLIVEHNSTRRSPAFLVRTAFDVTGSITSTYSESWWDEWSALIPADQGTVGGFSREYVQVLLNDGTTTTRLTMPCNVDLPQVAPTTPTMDASLTIHAAGDDTAGTGGAATTSTIKAENV